MKLAVLFAYFLCIKCNVLLLQNGQIPEKDLTTIPTEIVSNYLHKYHYNGNVFLSIAIGSSNPMQQYSQEDFVSNLMLHAKLDNFTYNILDKVSQTQQGNKKIFNLILVDGNNSMK